MSNIITQFMVDNVVHDIGADAKNVAYNEYISVKTQLENHNTQIVNMANDKANTKDVYNKNEAYNKEEIDNMIGNGTIIINQGGKQKGIFTTNQNKSVTINLDAGSGVSDADAVIENSLTVNGKLVLNDYKPSNTFSITQILDFKEQVSDFNLQLNEDEWGGLLPENFIYTNFNGTTTRYSYYIDYSFSDESITNTIFERLKINHYYLLTEDMGRSVNFIATPIKNSGFSGLRIFTSQKITYQATFDVQYEILMTPTQKGTLIQGQYANEENIEKYAHVVGGGTSDSDRKNIHTLDWDGNAYFASDVNFSLPSVNEIIIKNNEMHPSELSSPSWNYSDEGFITENNKTYHYKYSEKVFINNKSEDFLIVDRYYEAKIVSSYASNDILVYVESYENDMNTPFFSIKLYANESGIDPSQFTLILYDKDSIIVSLSNIITDLQSRIAALEAKINS